MLKHFDEETKNENICIEEAIRRHHQEETEGNQSAVLESIFSCLHKGGHFLVSSDDVEKMEDISANNYERMVLMPAFTSLDALFAEADDEISDFITEVEIRDLLKYLAAAKNEDASIDLNYNNKCIITADAAKSILSMETRENICPAPIPLYNRDLSPSFLKGMMYFHISASGAMGEKGVVDFWNDKGQRYTGNYICGDIELKNLERNFLSFKKLHQGERKKYGWTYFYLGCGHHLCIHDKVVEAYMRKMNIKEDDLEVGWSEEVAMETIRELPLKDKEVSITPMKITTEMLEELRNYEVARPEIPAGWAYLGADENERYVLGEPKKHNILVFGVNPSTAKPGNDDPTIRKIRKVIEKRKNGNGWLMMNLYPQRTPYPKMLENNGTTKTNIIDDKNSSHTEERIYWGPWRRTTQIAENPKEDTEQEHSDEDNTATTIQKNDVNNKDSKGNRSNDKQGEKTRGNSTETTGNPKDNSKKENTDPNREKRVELGKTIGIETFKFGGDLPVTLLNKQADSLAKEYRSLQKEIPAYVVKQGRLTKVGVLSPLGLIYDTYQDAQKYNGGKFVGAVAINGASFAFTLVVDNALVGTGVGALAVPIANSSIAILTNSTKEFFLEDTNKKQGRN